jgi:hypothetical protein
MNTVILWLLEFEYTHLFSLYGKTVTLKHLGLWISWMCWCSVGNTMKMVVVCQQSSYEPYYWQKILSCYLMAQSNRRPLYKHIQRHPHNRENCVHYLNCNCSVYVNWVIIPLHRFLWRNTLVHFVERHICTGAWSGNQHDIIVLSHRDLDVYVESFWRRSEVCSRDPCWRMECCSLTTCSFMFGILQ